jgi:hypothetical protein
VNTCIAKRYDAPQLTVRSCIGRSDDLLLGKSYYLDEVQSVIEVIRASHSNRAHLILLDELFRGTNAIERIAAGEATLRELATTAHLVICATHDVEIVAFLEGIYASFHFVDRMEPEGLVFEYQLAVGPSTTRNAISLLELNGAPEALVFRARERAAHLSALRQTDAQTSAHSVRSLNDQSSQRAVFSDLPSSTSALHLRHVLSATSTFGVSRQPSADRGVTPPARHVHSAGDHETALPALSFHRHHAPTDPSHAFTPAAWPSRPGDKQVMLGDRILDYFPAQSLRAISICRSSQMSPAPRLHPAR